MPCQRCGQLDIVDFLYVITEAGRWARWADAAEAPNAKKARFGLFAGPNNACIRTEVMRYHYGTR